MDRYDHRVDADYYSQAGALYRLMNEEQRALLTSNIASAMNTVPESIQKKQIEHFKKADPEYGARVEAGLKEGRTPDPRQVPVTR